MVTEINGKLYIQYRIKNTHFDKMLYVISMHIISNLCRQSNVFLAVVVTFNKALCSIYLSQNPSYRLLSVLVQSFLANFNDWLQWNWNFSLKYYNQLSAWINIFSNEFCKYHSATDTGLPLLVLMFDIRV